MTSLGILFQGPHSKGNKCIHFMATEGTVKILSQDSRVDRGNCCQMPTVSKIFFTVKIFSTSKLQKTPTVILIYIHADFACYINNLRALGNNTKCKIIHV